MSAAAPDPRNDPAHLRGVLGDTVAQLVDMQRALLLAVGALGYLTLQRQHVPHDVDAERRVLGAYVLGRLNPRALAELPRGSFAEAHLGLASILCALAELERFSPQYRLILKRLPIEGPRRRAAIGRLLDRIDVSIDELPWPASTPLLELAEVRARAKRRAALRGTP